MDLLYEFFGIVLVLLVVRVFVDRVKSRQRCIIKNATLICGLKIVNWNSNIQSF